MRIRQMRRWVLLLGVLVLLGASYEVKADVILRIGMDSSDAGQLDPHLTSKTPDMALLQWIFNGLVRFKPGSMDPATMEPDLAEKWTSSSDGRTWTFTLRKGVKFHGSYGELTAEDIVFSLERSRNPKSQPFPVTLVSSRRSRPWIPIRFELR